MAANEPERFDAIVIGSGFGGSVSAYRLAEAGQTVCLLERGKAYPPGSFARTPREMSRNFWDPSGGLHGLFDLWAFRGIDGVVSSGLGGGSLIYANVMLRKDERWFVDEVPGTSGYRPWPVTRAELDPHYDAVERILLPQQYPYPHTPKTRAFREAATAAGLDYSLPPMAVTYANTGQAAITGEPIVGADGKPWPNLHGRTRYTCRLCGECDVGCNYGSKNTLDYNYLSAFALMPNATIRTRCEVKSFWPAVGGGYVVEYVEHLPEHEGSPTDTDKLPRKCLNASRLVLSAGTFGTTYLLLKNQHHFPALSRALGTRFCGNGDLLGMVHGGHRKLNNGDEPRVYEPSIGSVITSTIRVPDSQDPGGTGPGFYIQDGGYPAFASWLAEADNLRTLGRLGRLVSRRLRSRLFHSPKSRIGGDFAKLLGQGLAAADILPLLGMGRDTPDGVMHLDRQSKYLAVDWNSKSSKRYFQRVIGTMEEIATQLDAKFSIDPLWHLGHLVITVHALGGCPMGRDASEGVIDSYGRVFNYPGFSIADGSVMPGPVGANPSLTIAALADRFADALTAGP